MSPKIFILLPVHNRKEITRRFIQSLLQQQYKNYHLVLIDDGSVDGTANMVTTDIPKATVIRGRGNWWWGGSLHQGYKWIKHNLQNPDDIVLIANDDIEFDESFLEKGKTYITNHPKTLLVSQAYSKQTGKLIDIGIFVDWPRFTFEVVSDKQLINCLSTRGLFMSARDFIKLGDFYPLLLPHYASDYEFTIRAKRKGFNLASDDQIKITMDETTTGTHSIKHNISIAVYLKNIFSKKNAANPIYLSTFVLLACPFSYILINLLRIWKGFLVNFLKTIRHIASNQVKHD